jgi:hypothetical protein
MQLSSGTRQDSFEGGKFQGLSFVAYLKAAANNTDIDSSDIDLSKINISCELHGRGEKLVLFSDSLLTLVAATGYLKPQFEFTGVAGNDGSFEIVAKDTSVKEECYIPYSITLPSVINVGPGQKIVYQVTINAPFSADIDTTASTFEVNPIEGIGEEIGVPVITSKAISQGDNRIVENLGNDIVNCLFLNVDKTTNLETARVVTSAALSSQLLTYNDTYKELLIKRLDLFANYTDANKRKQSFMLYTGEPNDNFKVDVSLVASNVNTSKCFLVWTSYKYYAQEVRKSIQTLDQRQVNKMSRIGVRR